MKAKNLFMFVGILTLFSLTLGCKNRTNKSAVKEEGGFDGGGSENRILEEPIFDKGEGINPKKIKPIADADIKEGGTTTLVECRAPMNRAQGHAWDSCCKAVIVERELDDNEMTEPNSGSGSGGTCTYGAVSSCSQCGELPTTARRGGCRSRRAGDPGRLSLPFMCLAYGSHGPSGICY